MSKKGLFTGLLALLLVFALLGCEPITDSEQWTKVTSLDGLEGTWKSSVTATEIDSGGKPTTVEQAMIITYPVSEKVSTETGEVDIKDGVKTEMLSNGKPVGYTLVPKNEFESMLKTGIDSSPVGTGTGCLFVNGSKTRLKLELITSVEGIEDEATWKEFQDSYKKMAPTGDITVAFSSGAPYTVTTTQILHKQ